MAIMITQWRHDLIERLLGILLESIPFELPVEVRSSLLEEPSGSWVFSSPISTARFQGQWFNASLHWMWQEETSTCCLNFLADEGHLEWGIVMRAFQWTLEASHLHSSQNALSHATSTSTTISDQLWTTGTHSHYNDSNTTECRRFEPSSEASTSCDTAIIPVKTFWKIGVLRTLGIEWRLLTLMGTLESWIPFLLSPRANFSCTQITWWNKNSHHSSTTTGSSRSLKSQEHVRLAHFLQYLESFPTPHLAWNSPPSTSTRTIHGTSPTTISFHTLADIFRFAYTWLEDQHPSTITTTTTTTTTTSSTPTTNTSPDQSTPTSTKAPPPTPDKSRILPGNINVRKSIGDSLAISGGLAATGASFISPIGVAVSVAAIGVKDGITIAANKGKETRNGDGYRLGDVARGVMATLKEQRAAKGTSDGVGDGNPDDDPQNGSSTTSRNIQYADGSHDTQTMASTSTQSFETQNHKARYAGVVGSSIGAAAGLALAGPIGFVAGSLIGGTTTQQAMMIQRRHNDENLSACQQQQDRSSQGQDDDESQNRSSHTSISDAGGESSRSWRLGDNVRNAVQRGKEVSGRDSTSDYQFGDLARGLFSRRK